MSVAVTGGLSFDAVAIVFFVGMVERKCKRIARSILFSA